MNRDDFKKELIAGKSLQKQHITSKNVDEGTVAGTCFVIMIILILFSIIYSVII